MNFNVMDFTKFEEENKLFDRKYNGQAYWQALRFIICEDLFSDRIQIYNKIAEKRGKKYYFFVILRSLKKIIINRYKLFFIPECEMVLFSDRPDKKKFFIALENLQGLSKLFINSSMDNLKVNYNDYNFIDLCLIISVKYRIKKKLRNRFRDNKEYKYLKELESKIRKRYGKSMTAEQIEEYIFRINEQKKIFKKRILKIFKKTKCKYVLVVCYYDAVNMVVCEAARECGLPVIEMQHGVISNHEEYWFEDQRGINNYTPDYFLTFGDIHASWTKLLPHTKVIPVGFPYQISELEKVKGIETNNKAVIIYPDEREEFEKIVDEFTNIAVQKGYEIYLKLHPLNADYYFDYYPILSRNKNIKPIKAQDKSIYFWLKYGRHHIMGNTTVGLEAIVYDHTNICISQNTPHEQTQILIDWGIARSFSTSQELMELVDTPVFTDKAKYKERVWRDNAQENINKFINEIRFR